MIVNIDFSQPMATSVSLGKLGEHNSTVLHITADLTADAITHYRVAFQTGGKAILSEAYETLPINFPLARQLTMYPRLSMQLVGYDSDGNLVTKSDKFSKFYFEPSVAGAEVEVDGSNHDLASEIVKLQGDAVMMVADIEELNERTYDLEDKLGDLEGNVDDLQSDVEVLDRATEVLAYDVANKVDKGTVYTIDEADALLQPKATREWVEAQNYARASDIPDVSGLATKDELATKQDILTEANAGTNITIENGVISATGGSDAKEPFYATYDVTPYEDVKQAIIDGRQVFLNYDTGNTATKYVALNYIGHNKGTEPYDVSADISGYIFRFSGLGGSITSEGGKYTAYYARLNSNGTYNSHSDEIVSGHGVVDYDPAGQYNPSDILTANGVGEAIEAALAEIGIAEESEF